MKCPAAALCAFSAAPGANYRRRISKIQNLALFSASLDPFELKKNIEIKLKKFFTVLGNLNREATKP